MRIDGTIPKEYHPYIIKYLKRKYPGSIIKYDSQKQSFVSRRAFFYRSISEKDVQEAWNWISDTLYDEEKKRELNEKYGDAVLYFYNEAWIDEKGIYIIKKKGPLGIIKKRTYFSRAKLDDILEKYNKRMKEKKARVSKMLKEEWKKIKDKPKKES